jgi:hypothetical protein
MFYEKNSDYLTMLLGENGDPFFLPKMKKMFMQSRENEILLLPE